MGQLVIIGNGFDLAHGYKTTYVHFIERFHCEALQVFELLAQKYCSREILDGGYWYNFEQMVNLMIKNWFRQLEILNWPQFDYESEEGDTMRLLYQSVQMDVGLFPMLMHQIERALCQFLSEETKKNQDLQLPSISEIFRSRPVVISFNYTNVAERYSRDIFYIHGSIEEGHIVFGHPPDPYMACVTPEAATLLDKTRLRDMLSFQRYIRSRGTRKNKDDIEQLMQGYKAFQSSFFSPDGEYGEIDKLPKVTRSWMARYRMEQPNVISVDRASRIKEMIVLGHSVHSDFDIFEQLLEKLFNLKKVTIYTYRGENGDHLAEKKDFFTKRGYEVNFASYE